MSRLTEAEREEWSAEAEVENTFSGVIAAPRKIFFGVLSWLMFWRSPTLKQKPVRAIPPAPRVAPDAPSRSSSRPNENLVRA